MQETSSKKLKIPRVKISALRGDFYLPCDRVRTLLEIRSCRSSTLAIGFGRSVAGSLALPAVCVSTSVLGASAGWVFGESPSKAFNMFNSANFSVIKPSF